MIITALGTADDWGMAISVYLKYNGARVVQSRCGIILLVQWHAHATRRRLEMSRSPFFWSLYMGPDWGKTRVSVSEAWRFVTLAGQGRH